MSMTTWKHSGDRHYTNQGSYWPRYYGRKQRYGVLQLTGYADGVGPKFHTQFCLVDTDLCASVVDSWTRPGRPGSDRVQQARVLACEAADRLNRLEREVAA